MKNPIFTILRVNSWRDVTMRNIRRRFGFGGYNIFKNNVQTYMDIAKVPPARGYMKLNHQANVKLLTAFDKLCTKNGIEWFIIGGPIIGKLQRNGFIPWDDDIDVGLLAKDWKKLLAIFQKTLPNKDFHIEYGLFWNVLKLVHTESGLFIDIFRYNRWSREIEYDRDYEMLRARKKEHQLYYLKHLQIRTQKSIRIYNSDSADVRREKWAKIDASVKRDEAAFDKFIMQGEKPSDKGGIIHFSGQSKHGELFNTKTIFPLQRIKFEGGDIAFPREIEDYAFIVWGNIWAFPNDVGTHHGIQKYQLSRYFAFKKLIATPDEKLYTELAGKK